MAIVDGEKVRRMTPQRPSFLPSKLIQSRRSMTTATATTSCKPEDEGLRGEPCVRTCPCRVNLKDHDPLRAHTTTPLASIHDPSKSATTTSLIHSALQQKQINTAAAATKLQIGSRVTTSLHREPGARQYKIHLLD
ncbi:hypothetical protein BRADI_1g26025v3 [Brachypodium distachyon]|uniref:Uncharacterized protein n=1 Tax=Brachypodium distachyon TaxID=15368 RepID=A0A2K2DL41_BRADI|nr:hypothetical protein BRADI_1g26025v3 [Brachypodium distachyon]